MEMLIIIRFIIIRLLPKEHIISQKIKNSLVWLTIVSLDSHATEIAFLVTGQKPPSGKGKKDVTGHELYPHLITILQQLSPKEFESFIAKLLELIGFSAARQSYVGDKGIDVIGSLDTGLTSTVMHVQVKHVTGNVGIEEVLKIRGTLSSDEHGAIITTGGFTKQAQEEAQNEKKKLITLIDGEKLIDMILEHYDELDDEYQDLLSLRKRDIPITNRFNMTVEE